MRRHLKPANKSWRVDETYVKVKGRWCYLYRAIDSAGATIDFLLSAWSGFDFGQHINQSCLPKITKSFSFTKWYSKC